MRPTATKEKWWAKEMSTVNRKTLLRLLGIKTQAEMYFIQKASSVLTVISRVILHVDFLSTEVINLLPSLVFLFLNFPPVIPLPSLCI